MKLNSHQQRYYKFFKHLRVHKFPKFIHRDAYVYEPSMLQKTKVTHPTKVLKQYMQKHNSKILWGCVSLKNHNLNPNTDTPDPLELLIHIENIPCVLAMNLYDTVLYINTPEEQWTSISYTFEEKIRLTESLTFGSDNPDVQEQTEVLNQLIPQYTGGEEEAFQISTVIDNPNLYHKAYNLMYTLREKYYSDEEGVHAIDTYKKRIIEVLHTIYSSIQ